jgi:hypothetical protein
MATPLEVELKDIMGKSAYASKKGYLKVIFKEHNDYKTGNQVDILKILTKLKNSHLLVLKNSKNVELTFSTTQDTPLLFMTLIKEVLGNIGYGKVITEKIVRSANRFLWKVDLQTSSVVDPLLFVKTLQSRGAIVSKVKRYSSSRWRYSIDMSNATMLVEPITLDKEIKLKKPLSAYWLDVENAKKIRLMSPAGNQWFPYIVFYDKNLRIIENYTKEIKSYNVKLKIPRDSKYIKISDIYTLENLKRGLNVYVSHKR